MSASSFLHDRFQYYYRNHNIPAPPMPEQREFGIGEFGKKIVKRHIAFDSASSMNQFLQASVPLYISYSNAYYRYPSRTPMPAKEFLQADLVYEFDSDDIKTDCKEKHDSWTCRKCGNSGKGSIDNCTNCGAGVEREQWVCSSCLDEAKQQTLRLLDFLSSDFNITDGISVNYSGAKGFHVHVRHKSILPLSQHARIELLDYLTAEQLLPESHGFDVKLLACPLPKEAVGWQKRILNRLIRIIETSDSQELAVIGNISNALAKKLISKQGTIISSIGSGRLMQFEGRSSEKFWKSLIGHAVAGESLKIDRQTSVDMHKIIRLPETLHGGTGLAAKSVEPEKLKAFSPLSDAIVFSEKPASIKASNVPRFELNKKEFGPYSNEKAELPEYAAVYLIARGAAELNGEVK